MFSLIYAWINVWVNNGEAGDLRRHSAQYDVNVMVNKLLYYIKCVLWAIIPTCIKYLVLNIKFGYAYAKLLNDPIGKTLLKTK